jgi:hypothetical protein
MKAVIFAAALASVSSVSAFTLNFVNNCGETVWAAVGQASNGFPDPNGVKFGQELGAHGGRATFQIDDNALGVCAWGRTGCDGAGANCATGKCNGGLICTDAGITSGVLLSEFGHADFGAAFGGVRTSWDLSRVDLAINLDTRLTSSDGQTVTCTNAFCPPEQAFNTPTDFAADRNSPPGQTFTHTFCP